MPLRQAAIVRWRTQLVSNYFPAVAHNIRNNAVVTRGTVRSSSAVHMLLRQSEFVRGSGTLSFLILPFLNLPLPNLKELKISATLVALASLTSRGLWALWSSHPFSLIIASSKVVLTCHHSNHRRSRNIALFAHNTFLIRRSHAGNDPRAMVLLSLLSQYY